MKLSTLKALYVDTLTGLYNRSEAENIFYIVIEWMEKKSKTDVIVGYDTLLDHSYLNVLTELNAGKPVQYVMQRAPFYTLDIFVNESVLIPRPETEELVHLVIQENENYQGTILDLGTGSGCIALALRKFIPTAEVKGIDISDEALSVAKENSKLTSLDVDFQKADILKMGDLGDVGIIVSNPPYISRSESGDMHKNVKDHEPDIALFVEDSDPLIFYKKILSLAQLQQVTCYFETSEFYKTELDDWMNSKNYDYQWYKDFQGKNRILKVSF